ncbi:MAG: GIY-YIG nuclease family protein [Coxiellaceae bacterium]|nr:GIY-YIG nuclease family protein [Coxiellaceae bacterium]
MQLQHNEVLLNSDMVYHGCMSHFVYILECSNGTYYTGYTTDLDRRYREHQQGSPKCKYTRSFPPKAMVAQWQFETASEAKQIEALIKRLSRAEKINLIDNPAGLHYI